MCMLIRYERERKTVQERKEVGENNEVKERARGGDFLHEERRKVRVWYGR